MNQKIDPKEYIAIRFEDYQQMLNLLVDLQAKVNAIDKVLTKSPTADKLLTRVEAADYLKVSLVTLNDWVSRDILIQYKIGNRCYFKKGEIDTAMIASGKGVRK